MRNSRERGEAGGDGVVRDPRGARGDGRRGGVLAVVLAGDGRLGRQLVLERELDPPGLARDRAEAAWDDGDVLRDLVLEDPELGGAVVLEGLVPVEVVRRQVEQDRDVRAEGVDVLQLEARELAHDPGSFAERAVEPGQRAADVPGHGHVLAGGAEDVSEKLARGRLAVRPGDAENRVGEEPEAELDLAPDGHPTLPRSGCQREPPEVRLGFSQAGPRRREARGRPRRGRLRRLPREASRVDVLPPVDPDDLHASPRQRERRRLARAGEAEDERPFSQRSHSRLSVRSWRSRRNRGRNRTRRGSRSRSRSAP